MATLGFPIYISIILCLTVKIRGDFTIITAVSKLKDMVDKLKDSVDSINVRIDNLEKLSNTNNVDSTEKDNVMTETGDVEQTNKRVIKALISEKVFVRKSLSVYEGKFKDFQKQMTEQMNVINSKFEASHDTCEQICAENVANLNSWNKSQENYLNRLEYAINNATIDRETCFIELQQTIDQVATNASTKIESVEMNIYESLPTRTEKIWASIGICPIPFDIDRRLSVKYEMSSSSHVDVREGNTIRNQDYAIFNCSNVIEQKYEPSNRRFQCVRGQWMEADISHDWKLGNNGAFPECREAICDHPCENGGVCFQDGLCRCEHMTTGERCQTLLCHKNCTKNGGECVKPGTCGNCPKSRHGENCELANCTIPKSSESSKYTYTDHEGNEIIQLQIVMNGKQISVECKYDSYIYDYYGVTPNEDITCVNGILDSVSMDCPDPPDRAVKADLCQKFKIKNGTVSRNQIGEYFVDCNMGYTLNVPKVAQDKSCNCSEGELVCFAGTKPVCKAADCEIPYTRLSVYNSTHSHLTEGDKISDQQYVFFNCPNVEGRIYEPVNRQFQCVRGKFIEADSNPVWKLNHNGIFPKCVEVKCDPPCQNGGVCYRDGECKCENMTTGILCETILCDESCAKNGGKCVTPGKCGNCPKQGGGNNCEIEKICEFPPKAATHNDRRTVFSPGESIFRNQTTCEQGYTLSSVEVMTCQDDGTWTDIIRCHKTNLKYLVRLQVADTFSDAGTFDNVYVRIGEQTKTTKMFGYFGRNKSVENDIRGIDVRPIQGVVVSKDKGGVMYDDHLSILYVSIFIEESDDYYVFTYRDQSVWLTASKPVELSISRHPERCIHTYGEAMNRSPKPDNRGKTIGFMSLRECKQRCATTRSLPCKSIYVLPSDTDSFGFGYCFHYTHSPDSDYFRNNTRKQTRRQYVSYKRICREP